MVAVALCGCTDLNTEIESRYTKFPNNPIAIGGEFEGCYYYLTGRFSRDFWEGNLLQGDEVVGCCYTTAAYFDNGRYAKPSLHLMDPDVPGTGGIDECLQGIVYTNIRIRNYGGANGKDPIVAPLRAIRAWYHFWNMEQYGDAPIIDRVLEENEQIDRAPRAEVAKFIEKELLEIIPQLNDANDASTYGRPNKWMAEALLVKLYMNWGVYTHDITTVDNNTPNEKLNDVVYWCDQITDSGLFEIGKGYRKKFFPDNGVHIKDFIYAVNVDPAIYGTWAAHEWNRWWDFRKNALCKPNTWGWKPDKSIAGNFVLTPECAARFNLPGDERNIMILKGIQTRFDENFMPTNDTIIVYTDARFRKPYGPLNYEANFKFDDPTIASLGPEDDFANLMKGARCMKYPPRQVDDQLYERKQANDIPLFRYADILLMKAEAIMRGAAPTKGDTPESLVNQIRDCASAPHVQGKVSFQDLLDERSREFILEPWRRNDLIRFGQFEADWGCKNAGNPDAKNPQRRLFPIPTWTMNTNTNWTQNPPYGK